MNCKTDHLKHNNAQTKTGLLQRVFNKSLYWIELQQLKLEIRAERRQLTALPQFMLKDLGISQSDAWRESQRKDIPEQRLRDLQSKWGLKLDWMLL